MNTCVIAVLLVAACVVSGADFAFDQQFHEALSKGLEGIHERATRAVKDVGTGTFDLPLPLSRFARYARRQGGEGGPGRQGGPGGPGNGGPWGPGHKSCCGNGTGFFDYSQQEAIINDCKQEDDVNFGEGRRRGKMQCISECMAKKIGAVDGDGNVVVAAAKTALLAMLVEPEWQTTVVEAAADKCSNNPDRGPPQRQESEGGQETVPQCSNKAAHFFFCVQKEAEKGCPDAHKIPDCQSCEHGGPGGRGGPGGPRGRGGPCGPGGSGGPDGPDGNEGPGEDDDK